MRNFVKLTLAVVIIISLSFYSCDNNSKDITEIERVEKISEIKNDTVFVNLVDNSINLIKQVKDPELAQSLSAKGSKITDEELERLSHAVGFKNSQEFINDYKRHKNAIQYLEAKYNISAYDNETIKSLAVEANNSSFNNITTTSNGCIENCERIARNCLIEAGAVSVIGNIGCYALDVTVVLGLVCHAAVISAQTAASDNCVANMEECKEECNDEA